MNKMNKLNKMVVDAIVNALEEGDAYEGANDDIEFVRDFVMDIDFSKTKIIVSVWKSIESLVNGYVEDIDEMEVDVGGLCDYLNENVGKICVDVDGCDKRDNEVEMSFAIII